MDKAFPRNHAENGTLESAGIRWNRGVTGAQLARSLLPVLVTDR
jgi:hypothetical protein